jgi:hypothetical protein
VVATAKEFYGLISSFSIGGLEYRSYRLGRTPVGTPHWSSVPLPAAAHVLAGYASLATVGNEVWFT